ncbi:MAG TPA: hypothetical protein VMT20_30135 [Terriglobia bacterium]|nr:hypothetical protein [Terriglobia bacterium]
MRPKDVPGCVDTIAAHPTVGPRYGSSITDLRRAWLSLLGRDAFNAVVLEELAGSSVRTLTASVTVFVSDDFVRQVKAPPLFWIGPELARRVARGDSPVLSDKKVQEANSDAGLNLVVWNISMLPEQARQPDLTAEGMKAFFTLHRGFLLKELIVQPETAEHLLGLRNSGGLLLVLSCTDKRYMV